jgi:hypothetical protein
MTDDFFLLPRNNFPLNSEQNYRGAEVPVSSCQGYCSGHCDECLPGRGVKGRKIERETHRPLDALNEPASGHKQTCTRDIWISSGTSCAPKRAENTGYFHIDDREDNVNVRKYSSPEFSFVNSERVSDGTSGRSVDFEKACKVRKTGKYHHPSRDQETQTLHETASAFTNPAGSSRAREFIEMSRHNHSPALKLPTGNSFQLLPTVIPLSSDPNGACFVSPTVGYPVSAPGHHPPFAQVPSNTHVLHPGNTGQDHFVYLPSQMYSHVPHAVSTVYTQVPPNVTTVGSPSSLPVILAPGHVAYKGPHAPIANYAIPGPAFVPSASPDMSMRHNQPGGHHMNPHRQYLMRPGSHVFQPMYQ